MYKILLGKDPEEIGGIIWSENFSKAVEENQVAGTFETDREDLFWRMLLNIQLHPCSMWYWIVVNNEQVVCGAIDPDDLDMIAEDFPLPVPDWVFEERKRMESCWDWNKYAEQYNKTEAG